MSAFADGCGGAYVPCLAVEAPRGLRGLPLFQPRVHPPDTAPRRRRPSPCARPLHPGSVAPPAQANEFAAGTTRCRPSPTGGVAHTGVIALLKPRAVCGACRVSSRGFTRPTPHPAADALHHATRPLHPGPAAPLPPPQANEFAAGTTRCRPSPTGVVAHTGVIALWKPRAVCGAFRSRCGGFSRSRTPALPHSRTHALFSRPNRRSRPPNHSTASRSAAGPNSGHMRSEKYSSA